MTTDLDSNSSKLFSKFVNLGKSRLERCNPLRSPERTLASDTIDTNFEYLVETVGNAPKTSLHCRFCRHIVIKEHTIARVQRFRRTCKRGLVSWSTMHWRHAEKSKQSAFASGLKFEGRLMPLMNDLKLEDAARNAIEHLTLENARITYDMKHIVCSLHSRCAMALHNTILATLVESKPSE